METEEIVTQTAKIRLDENGILRVTCLPGATQTLAQAHENMSVEVQLSRGKRRPILVDLTVIGNFFIGFNKSPMPTKLFTSEPEALEWLKEFLR